MKDLAGVRTWVSKQISEASKNNVLGKLLEFLASKRAMKTSENNQAEQDEDSGQHDKSRRRSSGFI